MDDTDKFYPVKDPRELATILKDRLPVSCMVHNQVMRYKDFKDVVEFFTIGPTVTCETWVMTRNMREDFGTSYVISAPAKIVDGIDSTPESVKNCFKSGGGVIDWNDMKTVFFPMPWRIGTMLTHIIVNIIGNLVSVHPGALYYMDIQRAMDLEIRAPEGVEIRRLNTTKNEEKFILDTWLYTAPGSEIVLGRDISRNPSGGAFIDGKCVSGVYIPAVGFLSALFTLKEFRGRGIAKNVMKFAFSKFANEGCMPCLFVEMPNSQSHKFHESLGMKIATKGNAIFLKELKLE